MTRRNDDDAVVKLIIETINEYRDVDDPLPDHELISTLEGELYGHRSRGE